MSEEASARLATSEHAVASASGDYRLALAQGEYAGAGGTGSFVRVQVRDGDGATVLDSPRRFSARFATDVLWDDAADRVWVYSSDVGAFVWDRAADGRWQERTLGPRQIADADPAPPALLVERHADVFGPGARARARALAERQRGFTDGPQTAPDDPRLGP